MSSRFWCLRVARPILTQNPDSCNPIRKAAKELAPGVPPLKQERLSPLGVKAALVSYGFPVYCSPASIAAFR
jgi:hypothetical protein